MFKEFPLALKKKYIISDKVHARYKVLCNRSQLIVYLCGINIYYISTGEILSKLSRENYISSHVKRSPSLWLHNKSLLWKHLVFHWCLYNKQNITYSLMDMNFIFSCPTRYFTRSLRSLVRYRVDHSKIKFLSTRKYVISSIYLWRVIISTKSKPDSIRIQNFCDRSPLNSACTGTKHVFDEIDLKGHLDHPYIEFSL